MTSFLDLPVEIRLIIYELFLSSTTLDYPGNANVQPRRKKDVPGIDTMAILRSCSLIYQEISPIWMAKVTLSFATLRQFLDVLSAVPLETRSQIRRVFTGNPSAKLIFSHYEVDLPRALEFLPGLHLDLLVLTIGGDQTLKFRQEYIMGNILSIRRCPIKELQVLTSKHVLLKHSPGSSPPTALTRWVETMSRADQSEGGTARAFKAIDETDPNGIWDVEGREEITTEFTSSEPGCNISWVYNTPQWMMLMVFRRAASAPSKQPSVKDHAFGKRIRKRYQELVSGEKRSKIPITWELVKQTEDAWRKARAPRSSKPAKLFRS